MIHNHFGDLAKVAGVNIAAISVSLTGIETAIRLAGLLAALIYTLLKIVDWIQERRERKAKKPSPVDAVVPLILAMLFGGCAAPKERVLDVARPIEKASVSVARAERHVSAAKAKIVDAKGATALLERTATPEQKPAIITLKTSLAEIEIAHQALSEELAIVMVANREAGSALDVLSVKYERAEARAAKYARLRLWGALIMGLVGGYAAWILVPSIAGPYKLYAVAGSSLAGVGITYLVL